MIIRRKRSEPEEAAQWAVAPIERVSRFQRALIVLGLGIAITGISGLVAAFVFAIFQSEKLSWGVFASTWGTVARYFLWSARRALNSTLTSDMSEHERQIRLGSQKWFRGIMERLVEVEIVLSLLWTALLLAR